jgi:hypothetical protein
MGKAWKYESMFDLDMKEDSFGDILFNAGVDVVAVDYDQFDTHDQIYKQAITSEKLFKPDFVMGYCYGAFPAAHCSKSGLILLDPCAKPCLPENSSIVDMDSFMPKYEYDTVTSNKLILEPTLPTPLDKILFNVNIFLSAENENSEKDMRGLKYRHIKNKQIQVIPDSTHWIMIEPARYTLANKILEIMNA